MVDEQKELEASSAAISPTLDETCATRDALEQRARALLAAVRSTLPSAKSSSSLTSASVPTTSGRALPETRDAVGPEGVAQQLECAVHQLVEQTARLAMRLTPNTTPAPRK